MLKYNKYFISLSLISIIFILIFNYSLYDRHYYSSEELTDLNQYTTVISMYFPLIKSKHSQDEFYRWNKNALMSIKAPFVLFTDNKTKYSFEQIKPNQSKITYFIYKDIWDLMNELENTRNKIYINEYKNNQWQKDPEKNIHNPELYAIWNLKAFICNKTIHLNPYHSKFFIYTDLGAWRHQIIPNWPDQNFTQILHKKLNNRMLFGQINYVDDSNLFEITRDSIEGTFYAGSKLAIKKYADSFYDVHDDRLFNKNLFIGKDQTHMNYLVYKTNSSSYVLLKTWKLHDCNLNKDKIIYDPWLFYQQYFSLEIYFYCSYEKKLSILTNL